MCFGNWRLTSWSFDLLADQREETELNNLLSSKQTWATLLTISNLQIACKPSQSNSSTVRPELEITNFGRVNQANWPEDGCYMK